MEETAAAREEWKEDSSEAEWAWPPELKPYLRAGEAAETGVGGGGLDWTGLDWTGLDWTGLDVTGLTC
jgi:hypothetical protein